MSRFRFLIAGLLLTSVFGCALNNRSSTAPDTKTLERITQLRKDMLLRRARALVQYEPIYQELETLLPKDSGAAEDIQRYSRERRETAAHLYDCGTQSMADKNYTQAEECFDLSNQLAQSAEKQQLLEKARLIRKQQDDKRRSEQLLLAYQQAHGDGRWSEARSQLDALLTLMPDHVQAAGLREQLNREIKLKMDNDLERARNLYSQGKVPEALALCNALLQIDPKNEELQALISRAEKVSKNIEKLSRSKK